MIRYQGTPLAFGSRCVIWYLLVPVWPSKFIIKHENSAPFPTCKAEQQFIVKISQSSPHSCTCDHQTSFCIKRCCQWFRELISTLILPIPKSSHLFSASSHRCLTGIESFVPVIFLLSSSSPCLQSHWITGSYDPLFHHLHPFYDNLILCNGSTFPPFLIPPSQPWLSLWVASCTPSDPFSPTI